MNVYPLRRIPGVLPARLAALLLLAAGPVPAQTPVLTQHNDNARTGANLQENILSPSSVSAATFGKIFTRSLDANVNGQILYVPAVRVQGVTRNVIYAYTSNNSNGSPCSVYAFDADDPAASNPLWHRTLPQSAQYTTCTPVIDAGTKTMYVLTKDTDDNGTTQLHAIDITTGSDKAGSPTVISGSVPGTGDGSSGGVVSFDTTHANDRPGLLLLGNTVYISFAHNTDSPPYHGWVFGYRYDQTKFTRTGIFCTTPNGSDGGIWMAGKGLAADAANNIYFTVGNGTFDAQSGGSDYSMCFVKLHTPDLSVSDWFAPFDEQANSDSDLDLGNCGVLAIPGTNRLFGGGTKFRSGFLLNSSSLGHFTPNGPDAVVQRLDNLVAQDSVGQNPVCWDASSAKYVYLWASGTDLLQLKYDPAAGKFNPAPVYKQTSGLTGGGSLTVTATGSANGLLWAVGNDAVFHAFDAADISRPEVWNSNMNPGRDGLPSVGHFQFPTVANGKAYVATGSGTIVAYGLLPTAASTGTRVLWNRSDGALTLWNFNDASGSYTQHVYGPFTNWSAKAVSVGPDNHARVLWDRADGTIMLWKVNESTGTYTQFNTGLYNGWTARTIAVGPDHRTRILWNKAGGSLALWSVNDAGQIVQHTYGPYSGWTAQSLAVGPDNRTRVLWDRSDGQIALWSVDDATGNFTQFVYGPLSGFTAQAVAVGLDNRPRLLWTKTGGTAIVWSIDPNSGAYSGLTYGPLTNWSARSIAVGPDNRTRLLWDRTDGTTSLWSIDDVTSAVTQHNTGLYGGWAAENIANFP